MTTVEILRKARDHIAQPGMWFQGNFYPEYEEGNPEPPPDDVPCCAFGAVAWASGEDPENRLSPADKWLIQALGAEDSKGLAAFNDAPGRTQAEVVALFDRAIELAEREATP